jgi:GNAT superfamily N-acetyltransferase
MPLKIADINDFDLVYSMALKFANSSTYNKYIDEEKLKGLVNNFLSAPNEQSVVLLYDDVGMLAAMAQPVLFGSEYIATEFAWWVEPEYRSKGVGDQLEEAFYQWAKRIGCKLATMACYDEKTLEHFKKKGWTPFEYAVIKEL